MVDPNRESHQQTTPYGPEAGLRSVILAQKSRLLSARLMSPTGIKAQYLDISHLKYTVSCGDEDKAKEHFSQNTLVVTSAKSSGIERFGAHDLRRCAKPIQWSINAVVSGCLGCAESPRKPLVKMGKEHLNKSTVVNGISLLRYPLFGWNNIQH